MTGELFYTFFLFGLRVLGLMMTVFFIMLGYYSWCEWRKDMVADAMRRHPVTGVDRFLSTDNTKRYNNTNTKEK